MERKCLNLIFFFLSTVLLGGGTVAVFQESFKFRFLPALLDFNIMVHFADKLCPYPG